MDTALAVSSRAVDAPTTPPPPAKPRLVASPVWPAAVDPGSPTSIDGTPSLATPLQLPLEYCLPNGLSATPEISQRLSEPDQPSIVPWVARLAQAVLEVVAAERPVTQLTSWVLPDIYRRLDRRHQLSARQVEARQAFSRQPRERTADLVRSVHVCHPAPEVAEVSVVTAGIKDTGRCRALALRLERRKGRWICTELDWA